MANRRGLNCLVFVYYFVVLFSCSPDKSDAERLNYFDLVKYIEAESQRLTEHGTDIRKTVYLNGKTEQKAMDVKDWKNELNAFTEADINKKSFLGKYEVDSIRNKDELLVKYSTQDEDFRTKELVVEYENEKPVFVSAIVAVNNALYSSRQLLVYQAESGYRISGNQKIRFLEPDSFYIDARFEKF